VTAGEATDIIVIFEGVDTDCAAVTGCAEHFQWCGSPDRVVVILILCERLAAILLVEAGCCLGSLECCRIGSVLVFADARCRWLLTGCFTMRMIIPRNIQRGSNRDLFALPSIRSYSSSLFNAASSARRCSNTTHSR
jgi:hypothetical protein